LDAPLERTRKEMTHQVQTQTGRYIYAVVPASLKWVNGLTGIDGGDVYTVSEGRLTAIVSDIANRKIRPERRNLAAHQEVLRRLMERMDVLPMRFGIIADTRSAIENILARSQEMFLEQLQRVAAKVEMGLRVTWDVPNIFEYFVNTHPELRAARDTFFRGNREPSHEEKIELGRMFERIVNEDREEHTLKVEEVLAPHCDEIKRNKYRDEREVMNLACLVEKDTQPEFEVAVFEAARLFDNNFTFDYNGPWAPHNFVVVSLEF
jgi:hypothetical protein